MKSTLEFAQQVLALQPFSKFLNAEITEFGESGVELRIPLTANLLQQNGFTHGGVLSYAADNALTFAGGAVLGSAVVTSEYKINYVRPAIGTTIIARSNLVYGGKTLAVCRCDVYVVRDGIEVLCALAQGTITSIGLEKPSQ